MPENILKASCTSARHAGSFDCLMASLILITMDNGRGHCAWWQSCTVPNQTHRGNKKKRKMYVIKQIKICAEYRDMLPRPRLDLSGTPGLRPIGLSPGSWQTSLGLGSMSRYSAQILICIVRVLMFPVVWVWVVSTSMSTEIRYSSTTSTKYSGPNPAWDITPTGHCQCKFSLSIYLFDYFMWFGTMTLQFTYCSVLAVMADNYNLLPVQQKHLGTCNAPWLA